MALPLTCYCKSKILLVGYGAETEQAECVLRVAISAAVSSKTIGPISRNDADKFSRLLKINDLLCT